MFDYDSCHTPAGHRSLMARFPPSVRVEIRSMARGASHGMSYTLAPFDAINLLDRYRSSLVVAAWALRRFAV